MRIVAAIYLCFCLTAGMAFGQPTSAAPPDEIFYNGKIITVDPAFRVQEAFAVKGEHFTAVGSNAGVKALAGPQTRLTDLRGHTVIPGLMDNHNHQYAAASLEDRGVDLNGVSSLAKISNRLRRAVAAAKAGEVVFTNVQWSETALSEKRGPSRQELDQVSTEHPIVVFRSRGAAYLNSAALKAAGISRETESLAGNPIPKDATGEPTGLITVPATVGTVARKLIPPATEAEQEEVILKAQQRQNAVGLTSIREVAVRPEGMRAYWRLWRKGKLSLRVSMGIDVVAAEAEKLPEILSPWGVGPGFGDHWLRLDCISEFGIDGVPNNSYLREPHVDRPGYYGTARLTPEQVRQAILTMQRYGWRPSIHISGDKALDVFLDAYEGANAVRSIREERWIVEHITVSHPDQMERLARLGVLVSAQFQPYNGAEEMIRTWGKERADRSVPMREWLDHHLIVSAGSDWPGVTNNPFVPLYFYVTRKTAKGAVSGASQKISREEALRVSTVNNAYTTFEEGVKGSIEPGKLADFLILSQDILTIPEEQILSVRPLATYVGGRKVFSGKDGSF